MIHLALKQFCAKRATSKWWWLIWRWVFLKWTENFHPLQGNIPPISTRSFKVHVIARMKLNIKHIRFSSIRVENAKKCRNIHRIFLSLPFLSVPTVSQPSYYKNHISSCKRLTCSRTNGWKCTIIEDWNSIDTKFSIKHTFLSINVLFFNESFAKSRNCWRSVKEIHSSRHIRKIHTFSYISMFLCLRLLSFQP